MKFWRGVVRQGATNGNPFSEPMNLVSNINGGLGIWTGYSPVYYKVPIIKGHTIKETYNEQKIMKHNGNTGCWMSFTSELIEKIGYFKVMKGKFKSKRVIQESLSNNKVNKDKGTLLDEDRLID